MAEYIERGSIEYPYMSMSMWGINSATCKAYNEGVKATEDAIKAMHTADVVEARRGKVIVLDHDEWWSCVYECCTCKGQWMLEPRKPAICCPYCGVRLDGKGECDV